MTRHAPIALPLLAGTILWVLAGCQRTTEPAAAPAAAPAAEPAAAPGDELAQWETELQAGEDRLRSAIGPGAPPESGPAGGAPAPPPTATTAGPPAPPPAEAPAKAPATAPAPSPARSRATADSTFGAPQSESALPQQQPPPRLSPCDEACAALASMERAATRICQLTGTGDTRCAQAEQRVARAREQVAAAGCRCGAQ